MLQAIFRFPRAYHSSQRAFSSFYTWGNGDNGELGHPTVEKQGIRRAYEELVPKKVDFFDRMDILRFDFGLNHSAAVTKDGKVYTWGSPQYGKLGLENCDTATSDAAVLQPQLITGLSHVQAVDVSCGEYHTAILDKDGRVFTFGWGGSFFSGECGLGHGNTETQSTPKVVEAFVEAGVCIKQVDCGELHSVAVSSDGEVWAFGNGEYGRMGNGSSSSCPSPEPVEYFAEMNCIAVAAGHSFSLALSEDGQVYCWGKNDYGQLGLGGSLAMDVYSMENYPRKIEALSNVKISQIAAGNSHCSAVSEDRRLFMWGMKLWLEPHEMTSLKDYKVVGTACGNNFTAALTECGKVFTFGKGRSSALGHDDRKTRQQPTEVAALSAIKIKQIAAGDHCMGALATWEPSNPDYSMRE